MEYRYMKLSDALAPGRIVVMGVAKFEPMRPYIVDRPGGTGDRLLMLFHDLVWIDFQGRRELHSAGYLRLWKKGAGHFPAELPLKGNYLEDKFKIYVSDTGILSAMLDEEARNDLRANRNLGVYKGALYENFVAEALSKSGYELFYYRPEDSSMEQDFFVRDAKHLIPVETKAGNNTAKSMRTLISSDQFPDIAWGIKLIHGNIGQTETITTFPYFCTFLLKRYLKTHEESRFSGKAVK